MPHERIEINPDIMDGKPVIRGSRVPVELILRKLGAGMSPEAILDADPDVLLYAGSAADRDELIRRPGWSEMRAVKTQRTYTVSRAELLIPGPRVVDGVEHLAALLHPVAAVQ